VGEAGVDGEGIHPIIKRGLGLTAAAGDGATQLREGEMSFNLARAAT